MKLFLLGLSEIAIFLLAIAPPAFGGRMIDPAGPVTFPDTPEAEATAEPGAESADEGEEPSLDPDMMAEPAEGSNDDLPVETAPSAPPSRWKLSKSFSLGVSTDDNIYLSATHPESDQIFTLSGNFRLLWGLKKEESYLAIDYTPTVLFFADHSQANAFNQNVNLAGQWRLTKLTLGAQIGVQSLSGGDVDVGDRAKRTLWQVSLKATYDYSTKTSLEVSFSPNASDYSNYLSSFEWVNSNWIDYQLFPKTRVGLGVTFGSLQQEGGRTQSYQQALLRITNPVAGKLTFNASGGLEFRQLGGGAGTQTTPVFRTGVSYQPFDGTQVNVEASRRIYSSASIAGENYVTTGTTVSVRQRLFQRYSATVSGGYEDAKYESTDGQASVPRHDQYLFLRPSVAFAFTKWTNFELYYEYRRNASTASFSEFQGNVAGVQATISF